MAIKYEAYTRMGEKVRGVLQADSTEEAHNMLEGRELIPYRLKPVRKLPNLVLISPSLFKPKTQDIIDFSSQLASLLNSGIPLRRALVVLRGQTQNVGLKEALKEVLRDVEEGMRFTEAFARHPTVFPDFM